MHHFIVVATRAPTEVDRRVWDFLTDQGPQDLSFPPQGHLHWSSANHRVQLASWSANELARPATGTADGGVVALAGLPVVTQPPDAAALLRVEVVARHARMLRDLTERLDGPYALLAIDPNGSGTIINDPFGLHPLYYGSSDSLSVVSNRAALVAEVLARGGGAPPQPDEEALAWLLLNGQMFGDKTPLRGVRRLPFGSGAALTRDGEVTIAPWRESPWSAGEASSVLVADSIDALERRMMATIRSALAASEAVASELTAGRDSRLVLELAVRAGVANELVFRTYGLQLPISGRQR